MFLGHFLQNESFLLDGTQWSSTSTKTSIKIISENEQLPHFFTKLRWLAEKLEVPKLF